MKERVNQTPEEKKIVSLPEIAQRRETAGIIERLKDLGRQLPQPDQTRMLKIRRVFIKGMTRGFRIIK